MASYIGKVQIANGASSTTALVGSTLYGICGTAANVAIKDITAETNGVSTPITGDYVNTSYDNLIRGSTIHIKFVNGNTVTSGASLKVGTLTSTQNVVGNFVCPANTIISFTLDENQEWVVNDNVDTNTEYVFKSAYNASTNRVLGEADVGDAAEKDVVTDIANNSTSTDLPTTSAVVSYVQSMTGGLAGLTGAMHFRGVATTAVTDGGHEDPTITDYNFGTNGANAVAGDVVLWQQKEFVWTGSVWELLGDEGSYALKSNTDTITEVGVFTKNTLPTLDVTPTDVSKVTVTPGSAASLTTNNVNIPNVTNAGTPTEASVTAGVLNISIGSAPTIAASPITVKEVGTFTENTPTAVAATTVSVGSAANWNAGTQANLTTNDTIVVVPGT